MKKLVGLPLCGLLLASQAGAVVLVSDNFSGLTSGQTLQTRTPDGTNFINNVNSNGWSTNSIVFSGNGSGGLAVNNFASRNVLIDLGAGYFTTNPGVYTLSVTMTTPTGQTGTSWAGIGYTPINTLDQSFNGLNSAPWLLHRNTGNVQVFGGPDATNGTSAIATTTGAAHTFVLRLDTSTPQWTVQATIDSVAVDLNGASAGTTFTYGTNPTAIRYIGIATAFNNDSSSIQTLDNFLFEGPVPIPEPAGVSLAAAAGGMFLLRRRRVG